MALSKRTYTAGIKITAENLNAIQDAIIALEAKGITKDEIITALGYTPAKNSDIPTVPTADINANTSARHTHSNKTILDGITGQVTAEKIKNPDHPTDLVQYGAFQVAAQQIIAQIPTVPNALKNPNALTIKIGSTSVTYDGSSAKTVTIEDGTEVSY